MSVSISTAVLWRAAIEPGVWDALRVEAQGKIKVTVVRPTGVPATGLGLTVVKIGRAHV